MRAPLVLVLGLCLAGCSGAQGHPKGAVVASFYPLAWAAEHVLPSSEHVVDLTPPGVEPHDVELSPSDVEMIQDARLVVYVGGGFQPAVETARPSTCSRAAMTRTSGSTRSGSPGRSACSRVAPAAAPRPTRQSANFVASTPTTGGASRTATVT
jgi:hypothetical protein